MVLAKLVQTDFAYQSLLLVHLVLVVVGFGSSFAWPALAAKGRKMEPAAGYALSTAVQEIAKPLTTYCIYAAGFSGIVLVGASNEWKFSQAWVSISFVLFFGAVLFAGLLHVPNLKAMNALQGKLLSGDATPTADGPPAEVAELQARGKRAGMYGGLLHLVFLLLVIDMIWKPGL